MKKVSRQEAQLNGRGRVFGAVHVVHQKLDIASDRVREVHGHFLRVHQEGGSTRQGVGTTLKVVGQC